MLANVICPFLGRKNDPSSRNLTINYQQNMSKALCHMTLTIRTRGEYSCTLQQKQLLAYITRGAKLSQHVLGHFWKWKINF